MDGKLPAWERDESFQPVMYNTTWRHGAPKVLKELTPVTLNGHYAPDLDPSTPATVTWPDGTTTETTFGALLAAGLRVADEPEADIPTVVKVTGG